MVSIFQRFIKIFCFLFFSSSTILVAQETAIYKSIQLGTFSYFDAKDYEEVRSIAYVYAEPLASGQTRVLLGGFETEALAKTALSKVQKSGFSDAFITTKQLSKDYTVSVVQLATFKPDAIIAVHAPYGIVDFDSHTLKTAPKSLGKLHLNLLGTYPGSLGNYAGINRNIPVITLELPHSWIMPSESETTQIWEDIVAWLNRTVGPNIAQNENGGL